MKKRTKIIFGVCLGVILLCILSAVLFIMWLNGTFEKNKVREISSYESPDGSYTLSFNQLGDPQFPFGSTAVRLILKDRDGEEQNITDTEILDDGANSSEGNVKSVEWGENSVVVILQASEMPDKTVEIKYEK